jgi:uncharacterized protein YqjF (DUF2071 family)
MNRPSASSSPSGPASSPSLERRLAVRERPAGKAAMYHTWRHLLFAHWRVEPERIQRTLPAGLSVDTFDGAAYIGVVPFFMRNIRPWWSPRLPWLSDFLELNVRTYVHDASGTPGVWFYSLDCNQPVTVWGARTFYSLPYRHARMSAAEPTAARRTIEYSSRLKDRERGAKVAYTLADDVRTADPGTLEFFLAERYLMFAIRRRRILSGRVFHRPYPLVTPTVTAWSCDLLEEHDFGIAAGAQPELLHGSPGVDVEVFALE